MSETTVPKMSTEQQLEYRTLQLEFMQLQIQAQAIQTKLQGVSKRMSDAIITLAGTTEGLSFNQDTLEFLSTPKVPTPLKPKVVASQQKK